MEGTYRTAWPDRTHRTDTPLQGTRDLNPQPAVLETAALPIELVPFGPSPPLGDRPGDTLRHQEKKFSGKSFMNETRVP